MKIKKQGLIYCPSGKNGWDKDTFMTPHAMLISEDVIRIWGGCRDESGVSRIKYIDVSADNPSKVLFESDKACLDIGEPGCFDDNGVILGDIIEEDDKLYMFYVGFQHVEKVKFFAFSGVAVSTNRGETFSRIYSSPIMDRSPKGRFGRCIHTILQENGGYTAYYAIINAWKMINNIPYPVYNIWRTVSSDKLLFSSKDDCLCVDVNENEYRIGRPKVYKTKDGYEMFYTRDLLTKEYLIGYATSKDGINWERKDTELLLNKSDEGWDSQMACYPVKIEAKGKTYLIYNGNGMGKTGIGYAEIER